VGDYRVSLTASAEKEPQALSSGVIARIVARLELSVAAPRPHGCKELKGGDKEWRIRVGAYRIVYVIDDHARTVDVTRIAHRRDVYR